MTLRIIHPDTEAIWASSGVVYSILKLSQTDFLSSGNDKGQFGILHRDLISDIHPAP